MKKLPLTKTLIFACLASTSVYSQAKLAGDDALYVGIGIGPMMVDNAAFGTNRKSTSDAFNMSLTLGFQFDPAVSVEFQYSNSISDGEMTENTVISDYTINTIGIYGVYRSEDKLYFKGKAGFLQSEIEGVNISGSNTDFSGGLGIGYRLDNSSLPAMFEAEYIFVDEDVYYLTVSYKKMF